MCHPLRRTKRLAIAQIVSVICQVHDMLKGGILYVYIKKVGLIPSWFSRFSTPCRWAFLKASPQRPLPPTAAVFHGPTPLLGRPTPSLGPRCSPYAPLHKSPKPCSLQHVSAAQAMHLVRKTFIVGKVFHPKSQVKASGGTPCTVLRCRRNTPLPHECTMFS